MGWSGLRIPQSHIPKRVLPRCQGCEAHNNWDGPTANAQVHHQLTNSPVSLQGHRQQAGLEGTEATAGATSGSLGAKFISVLFITWFSNNAPYLRLTLKISIQHTNVYFLIPQKVH